MNVIDGLATSKAIKQEIKEEIAELVAKGYRKPHLGAILVGNDGASMTYVESKVKACEDLGLQSTLLKLPAETTEKELLAHIAAFNANETLDGFIVQLPLPPHISESSVIMAVDPAKDVDGFHLVNVGKLALGLPTFISATPNGIVELIRRYNIPTAGKHCVVLGRSNIVGSPISILMYQKTYPGDCTVTVCHSRTENLVDHTRKADILIVAIGKPEFVKADMVKRGATVIDVGVHRIPDSTKQKGYRLVGDVKFDEVAPLCEYITPVPGGVGPMTIASLLGNTIKSYRARLGITQ